MEAIANNTVAEVLEPKKSGRGNYERKKRGSYKGDKKITIKFFLNKRLKPDYMLEQAYYPLYIQISLKGQTTFFPATSNGQNMTIEDTGEYIDSKNYKYSDLKYDIILQIIDILQPFARPDFKISELVFICTSLYSPLYSVLIESIERKLSVVPDDVDENEYEYDYEYGHGMLEWMGILQILFALQEEDGSNYYKIDQELWCLEEYSKLIKRRAIISQIQLFIFFSNFIYPLNFFESKCHQELFFLTLVNLFSFKDC